VLINHRKLEIPDPEDGIFVCTSAPNKSADYAANIYYRKTPTDSRYFGIFYQQDNLVTITNVDTIEDLAFFLVQGDEGWVYSHHSKDTVKVGEETLEGGRAFVKFSGDPSIGKLYGVRDGNFTFI